MSLKRTKRAAFLSSSLCDATYRHFIVCATFFLFFGATLPRKEAERVESGLNKCRESEPLIHMCTLLPPFTCENPLSVHSRNVSSPLFPGLRASSFLPLKLFVTAFCASFLWDTHNLPHPSYFSASFPPRLEKCRRVSGTFYKTPRQRFFAYIRSR